MATTASQPYSDRDITLSCNLSTSVTTTSSAFASDQSVVVTGQQEQQEASTSSGRRLRDLIGGHFVLNINWFHNGRPIDFDHRKRRSAEELLLIRDFQGPDDNGLYQCSVRLTAPDYEEESWMAAIELRSVGKSMWKGVTD